METRMNLEEMSIEEIRRHVVMEEIQESKKIAADLLLEIKKNIFKGANDKVLDLDRKPPHAGRVATILRKEGLKVKIGDGYRGETPRFTVYLPEHLKVLKIENPENKEEE